MNQNILIHSLIPIEQLLQSGAYLNGCWIDGEQHYTVRNPHTLGGLACIKRVTEQQLVHQCAAVTNPWNQHTRGERQQIILCWLGKVRGCQNALALIHGEECGISWLQARSEIRTALEEARQQVAAGAIALGSENETSNRLCQIDGGNHRHFHSALIASTLAMMAGQPLLLRPPQTTPLSCLALAVIAERVSLPAGAFNVAP